MDQRGLEELFRRFRVNGDAAALGLAFDRSANELLGLARHLAGNRADAEDLVQATYLTAIEKLRTLEPGRDPLPWLVGILVLHARNQRRKRGRALELPELAGGASPDEELACAELSARVREALSELPERYSAVLAPYLAGERSSASIALATGRAPGTVRMQIHRGLALLRRALGDLGPLGMALGVSDLAKLRQRVLERALRARGLPVPAASGTLPLAAALALLISLLGIGAWFAWPASPLGVDAAGEVAAADPAALPSIPDPEVPASALRTAARISAPVASSSAASVQAPGVRGWLSDPAGVALVSVEVRLIAVPPTFLELDLTSPPQSAPEFERARCTTDAEGRFALPGARRGELLLLAIDCGGPRGGLRVVDGSPAPDGDLDLGEVRQGATVELRGHVLDESGTPLAGVRVRAGAWPAGFETQLCADGFANEFKGALAVNELPRWMRPWLAEFPAPTVHTAIDGAFTLRVSGASTSLCIDSEGRAPLFERGIALAGDVVEIGARTLAPGRTVVGTVTDSVGLPVSGAEVLVGARDGALPAVALVRAPPTDTAGRFTRSGVGTHGPLIVAARRNVHESWKVKQFETGAELVVRLDSEARLEVSVLDETGAPLEGAEVDLRPCVAPGVRPNPMAERSVLTRTASASATFESLAPGAYHVTARKPGHATVSVEVALSAPLSEVSLALQRAERRMVVVKDAASGALLAGARVALRTQQDGPLARSTSDSAGVAELWTPLDTPDAALQLDVAHSDYAPRSALAVGPAQTVQEVGLDFGGTLLARVFERGQPSSKRVTLTLQGPARSAFPLQCSSDASGVARAALLAPGAWRYELSDAWIATDALPLWLEGEARPAPLRSGTFQIGANQLTELAIELDPGHEPPGGGRARLRGRFHLAGGDATQLQLDLDRAGGAERQHFETRLDAQGAFDFGWIDAGTYRAELRFRRGEMEDLTSEPWRERITLSDGEIRQLDVTLQRTLLMLVVRDSQGSLVDGAELEIQRPDGQRIGSFRLTTDERGACPFVLHSPGSYLAVASHPQLGYARQSFEVAPGEERSELTLALDPGVSCAGVVQAPLAVLGSDTAGGRWIHLSFRRVDDPSAPTRHISMPADANGRGNFSIAGLAPGAYRLHLGSSGSARPEPLELVLGPNGASGVELVFQLAND